MEWTNEKREEILKALTVIQEVCNNAPACEYCPLRNQDGNCTLQRCAPHRWDLNNAHQEWCAFR